MAATLNPLDQRPPHLLTPKVKALKVLALGDSLVYGYGDPDGGGWVERLRRQWMTSKHSDHILYNLGIRGDRITQVSERLEQEFRIRGELRNRVPDRIILSVGVNDCARLGRPEGRLFTDFVTFQQQVSCLLDRALQLCPVLYIGMVPVVETRMPFLDCFYYNHLEQFRYKEATRLACATRNIPYLDTFELWKNCGHDWLNAHMSPDGLHPNVLGYQSLLQDIVQWEPMESFLDESLPEHH